MKIVETIIGILDEMKNDAGCALNSYQYNDKMTANLTLDRKMEDITGLLIQITDFQLDLSKMTVREKCNLNVSFLKKETKLDAQGMEQDRIIDETKDVAIDFLRRVFALKGYRVTDDTIRVKSVFLRGDSARSGVNISFEIVELQGECL